jgi:hypothetical protein
LLCACRHEHDFVDCPTNRKTVVNDKNANHDVTCRDTLVGKVGHGGSIVSEENAIVYSRPRENLWIIVASQTDFLDANDVKILLP